MTPDVEVLRLMTAEARGMTERLDASIQSIVSKGTNFVTVMFILFSTSILLVTLFNQWIFVFSSTAFWLLVLMFHLPLTFAIGIGVFSFLLPKEYAESALFEEENYNHILQTDELKALEWILAEKKDMVSKLELCLERENRRFEWCIELVSLALAMALLYAALVTL